MEVMRIFSKLVQESTLTVTTSADRSMSGSVKNQINIQLLQSMLFTTTDI
jgi:hypothetical protein